MPDQFLLREDILGWDDFRGKGIRLLTADPARHIFIPGDLEDYSGCRAELDAMGIAEIDPQNKWRIYLKMVVPSSFLMVSLAGVFLLQNPITVVVAGVVMLACTYWHERIMRQIYKNGPVIGLWVANVLLVIFRLRWALHYPPLGKPFLAGLFLFLALIAVLDWLYRRRHLSRPNS